MSQASAQMAARVALIMSGVLAGAGASARSIGWALCGLALAVMAGAVYDTVRPSVEDV